MTIRFKLTMFAIAIILVVNVLLSIAGFHYLGGIWLEEIQDRVRLDLRSAETVYNNHVGRIHTFLHAASLDQGLANAMSGQMRDGVHIRTTMDRLYQGAELDFLTLLDASGTVYYRPHQPGSLDDSLADNPLVREAQSTGEPTSGTLDLPADSLAAEEPHLAELAAFQLQPTPAAKPTSDTVRTNGLVTAAVAPLIDRQGSLVGYLYGGNLLNRRNAIVDQIKEEVFFGESHQGRDIGTVTIFHHDLRIATNVMDDRHQRAIGTRMSAPVFDRVLIGGQVWAAPAFVVNDWYITAYKPIRDPAGTIVGALYVGLLREPFLERRNAGAGILLGVVFVGTLLILALLFATTNWVLYPIDSILRMCTRVTQGDLAARVGIRPLGELGTLCEAVDSMADAIQERDEKLRASAQKQIGRSEKLASIGRLAAGIAHEINNPLTGVLTFAHLIRDRQGDDGPDREDLDLIIQETQRTADIVQGLLDFARERPTDQRPLDVNEITRTMVRLVENQKEMRIVHIEQEYADDLPPVLGDKNQLQQVLLNLILNAAAAMEGCGTLTIRTSTQNEEVLISVADTGCGILPENMDQIFDPFFTTKPVGQGTGLGLSVSYGIVQNHNGSIDVTSEVDLGSEFVIRLPIADDSAYGIIDKEF